jgi:hypothetical protein
MTTSTETALADAVQAFRQTSTVLEHSEERPEARVALARRAAAALHAAGLFTALSELMEQLSYAYDEAPENLPDGALMGHVAALDDAAQVLLSMREVLADPRDRRAPHAA